MRYQRYLGGREIVVIQALLEMVRSKLGSSLQVQETGGENEFSSNGIEKHDQVWQGQGDGQ